MLQQLCDDASNSVLIRNNGANPEWGYNPFSIPSIVFNENSILSVIDELSQTLGVIGHLKEFLYIRAKATSLPTCCIVSNLCLYTATKIK